MNSNRSVQQPLWKKITSLTGVSMLGVSLFMSVKHDIDLFDFGIWTWISFLGFILSFVGIMRRKN